MMQRSVGVVGSFLVAIVVSACGGAEHRPAATTRTTSAALVAPRPAPSSSVRAPVRTNATSQNDATTSAASAVVRLSSARCDRAAACSASMTDRDACMNEVGGDLAKRFPEDRCVVVSTDALAACAAEVGKDPCGAPNSLDAFASCTRDRLCPAPVMEAATP